MTKQSFFTKYRKESLNFFINSLIIFIYLFIRKLIQRVVTYDSKWSNCFVQEKDQSKIRNRVSEAQLQFATDEDTLGPDPLARRYDFSKNPLDYAQEQKLLIERFRKRLMTEYVKDGDSWGLRADSQHTDEGDQHDVQLDRRCPYQPR